ncbi:hypothetical protein PRIPAC_87134 [Pristionchus pacificus]|uniref:G protein-coupled receptor n=1 Tax=Pristionchus pacificus TaxID=54126 RepID=A0A2A6B3N6_PRIPA|nr:hypothetical protein PRIPAC_87134 [Pristionchus pacificus]|eukprot:PDM60471.1 G protein-coupled receptor [Pristionchus pacificus]
MTTIAFRKAEHIHFGIAMCLNVLALTLIFTKSRKEINQYRKLLVIFLISGIFFAVLHLILSPTCIMRENAFITYGSGWITDMRFISVYYGVASMSFLILAMHFIYRAVVLSSKTYAIVEISNRRIVEIIVVLIIELIIWTILCAVFLCNRKEYAPTIARLTADLEHFPETNHDGRLLMFLGTVDGRLNLPPFLAIVSMILLCGVSLTMIIWSSVRIVSVLNDEQHRSSTWRKYNYQLFVALYLQFLGPLILLYLPCITVLLLPFVPNHGIDWPPWLLSLFYSIYPIGISMCLILLALYLILTKSRTAIGQYRKLLAIFLVSGMFFAILHIVLEPTAIMRGNLFLTYGTGLITDMRFIAVYYGVVSLSFIILASQFLYRAVVLSSKTNSLVEISTKNILQLLAILIVELIIWILLCMLYCYREEYAPTIELLTKDLDDFPRSDLDGRLMIDNKLNIFMFVIIISMISLCGVSLAAIIWSSVRIISALRKTQNKSSSWRKHNIQLFIALYLQFLGPLILLYIPCISYLLLPFVPGQSLSSPPWLLSLFYSIYPIVDPLVMIIFIRDYRRGLYNLLRKAIFLRPLDDSTVVLSGGNNSRHDH